MVDEPIQLIEMRTALRMVAATLRCDRLNGPKPMVLLPLESECARIAEIDVPLSTPSPLSPTTTRNLACLKWHLEIAEVSKRTQALMPSIVNFKDALRRLAEVEAALAEYDAAGKEKST